MDAAYQINPAWKFHRIEAPTLIPISSISSEYDEDSFFRVNDRLALKPETTTTSYQYAEMLVSMSSARKTLPACIWQCSKSYRNEQDKTLKHIRLKEFYQLEFQFIYPEDSKADYVSFFREATFRAITKHFKHTKIRTVESDRLPHYSQSTHDIEIALADSFQTAASSDDSSELYWIEVASMSDRTDCPIPNTRNIEIAIGIDRLMSIY